MTRFLQPVVSALAAGALVLVPSVLNSQQTDSLVVLAPDSIAVPSAVPTGEKHGFWQSKAVRISTVPVILFAGSALTWPYRNDIREFRNRYIPTFRHHYDDYLQYVPALTVFGLQAAGVKSKHTFKRSFISYAFSAAIMGVTVNTIKNTADVERPDGSADNSFPSGHTANSFMNATFLHKEYGQYRHPLYSVLGYTMSTTTAISRELNNRHWISDVLAGAGIGILSTELGYLIGDAIFKERGLNPPLHNNPVPINKKPSFLEMRLGYAFATSSDLTGKNDDLFAKRGFNLGLQGAWFFHKNIGVGGEFAFTSFPVNDDNLKITDPDIDSISTGYYTQPMGMRYLNAGPFFSFPLPRNWFITANANAGVSVGAEGNVNVVLNDEWAGFLDRPDIPYYRYKPESAFSWSLGWGIQKRIERNVGLKFYGAFHASTHDFDIDVLDDVDVNGNYTFKPLGTRRVQFDHFVFGFALTAFIW